MAKSPKTTSRRPRTPEEWERRMIGLAMQQAERQLAEGKAPPSVVSHYLKLGSTREELEKKRIENEIALQQVKADAISSNARTEELMEAAIAAFRQYAGDTSDDSDL